VIQAKGGKDIKVRETYYAWAKMLRVEGEQKGSKAEVRYFARANVIHAGGEKRASR
jgi:hypothetical protein